MKLTQLNKNELNREQSREDVLGVFHRLFLMPFLIKEYFTDW